MSESKLESLLKEENQGKTKSAAGQTTLKTTLEQELEGEDTELAKELQRTRAEEIIARRRITIDRMRAGQAGQDRGEGKTSERGKEWLTDLIQSLLDKGLDEKRVGNLVDYLLGTGQSALGIFPSGVASAQGITLADVFAIQDRMNANKPSSDLENIIKEMRDEIKAFKNPPKNTDPVAAQASQFESLKNLVDSLVGLGVVQRPGTGAAVAGESLDIVKEKNRHAEEILTRQGEVDYKKQLGETIADFPKRVGEGLASRVIEQEQTNEVSLTMEHMKCATESCGFNIPYPPEATSITCPKCGTIYARTKKE